MSEILQWLWERPWFLVPLVLLFIWCLGAFDGPVKEEK